MDAIDQLKKAANDLKTSVGVIKDAADRTESSVASANDKIGVAVDILNQRKNDPELLEIAASLNAAKQTLAEEAEELKAKAEALEAKAADLDKASEATEVSGGRANR